MTLTATYRFLSNPLARVPGAAEPISPSDKGHAFQWLNTAYQEHDVLIIGIRADFAMDPLRSDPRFAAPVRKIGLP